MPNWSRLLKSFSDLFSGRGGEKITPPQKSPINFPLPRQGVGGFVARQMDRFRSPTPPPIQEDFDWRPGVPPVQDLSPQKGVSDSFTTETDEGFDAVEILGRDATYDSDDWQGVQESEVRVVQSSNVYSYSFEPYSYDSWRGTLFVTFLNWLPGMKNNDRSGPGATYAYSDFSAARYQEFNAQAEASAGAAVWDFCRIRGTQHGHQHSYRLVSASGEYVPRKVTSKGFKRRTLIEPGLSPLKRKMLAKRARVMGGAANLNALSDRQLPSSFRRSTLPDETFGTPDRGTPNRGRPNRGR